MRTAAALVLSVLMTAFLSAVSSPASAQNMDAMSKWAAAKVIHYHVVGDFSGTTNVLKSKDRDLDGGDLDGKVTDHVEIDFDWDQAQQKMTADPVFKNFPTKVESLDQTPGCAEPKMNGPFEYFTFQSVRATVVMFELQGRRGVPPGTFQLQGEGGCGTVQTPAANEPVTARMQLALGMILAMPMAAGEMEVTEDGKSIIQKINTDGWVWTMTPTIVQ